MTMKAFRNQWSAYVDVLRWSVSEGFRPVPGTVIAMVGGNLGALALQVNAVAITVAFGRALSTGSTVSILGFEGDPRQSGSLVMLAGLGVFLSMLGNAVARYASRLAELRLRERFAARCWSTALGRIAEGRIGDLGELPPDTATLQRIVRADAILCSRFAALLILTLLAVGKLVLAIGTLLYIDPLLTSIILGAGTGLGIVVYILSLRSARFSTAFEDATPDARDETRAILDGAAYALRPGERGTSASLDLPARDRFLRLYSDRLRAADDSEAIGNLFLAIVLSTTIVGIGFWARGDDQTWRYSAAFLIALPYALLIFRELARTSTSLNRFYPMVRRFRNFVRETETETPASGGPTTGLRIAARPAGSGGREDVTGIEIPIGGVLTIRAPHPPDRMTAGWLLRRLAATSAARREWSDRIAVASSRSPAHRQALHAFGWGWSEFEDLSRLGDATDRGHIVERHFLPGDPLPAPETHLHSVPRFLIAVVAASRLPSPNLVFIDARSLQELPERGVQAIRHLLRDHVLVVVAARGPLLPMLSEDTPAAVVGARGDVQIGDFGWLLRQAPGDRDEGGATMMDLDESETEIDDL